MGSLHRLTAWYFAAAVLTGWAAAATAPVEIAPGDYVRHGVDQDASMENQDAIANIGFIVGSTSVAVIDPGGSLTDGKQLRAAIRAVTPLPIKFVIMTHGHPDHIFGGSAFLADHPVYVGQARLPAMLTERGDYYRQHLKEIVGAANAGDYVLPSLEVATRTELDIGDRPLELAAHATAHTDSDLTIFDRKTGTLWAGDLLFVGRVPALDGSLTGWLGELKSLRRTSAARAVPGHGPVSVAWPAAMDDEQRYLETLARETRHVLAKGGDLEQAVATVAEGERDKWLLFDDYNGRNVTEAFRELEWE